MKFTASSEKFLEDRIPGVKVPPGHWVGRKRKCLFLDYLRSELDSNIFQEIVIKTYRSRPWVGNLASVLGPLVVMAMFVGKGSVEDITDIGH